jgi:proteasome beta subunit
MRPVLYRAGVVRVLVEALYDAADDDSATGGPDLTRRIFPVVMSATAEGTSRAPDEELDAIVREILAERAAHPGA